MENLYSQIQLISEINFGGRYLIVFGLYMCLQFCNLKSVTVFSRISVTQWTQVFTFSGRRYVSQLLYTEGKVLEVCTTQKDKRNHEKPLQLASVLLNQSKYPAP